MPPRDDLLAAISDSLKSLREKNIVVITSKVVSIWQGRCIPVEQYPNQDELIVQEADAYLPRETLPGAWVMQTIKHTTSLFPQPASIKVMLTNIIFYGPVIQTRSPKNYMIGSKRNIELKNWESSLVIPIQSPCAEEF